MAGPKITPDVARLIDELRSEGLGAPRIARVLDVKHGISIDASNVTRWMQKHPARAPGEPLALVVHPSPPRSPPTSTAVSNRDDIGILDELVERVRAEIGDPDLDPRMMVFCSAELRQLIGARREAMTQARESGAAVSLRAQALRAHLTKMAVADARADAERVPAVEDPESSTG